MRAVRVRFVVGSALLLLTTLLSGCETVSYYGQATVGELMLLGARQPLERVLADTSLPTRTRQGLRLVIEARAFAAKELGLPVARKYATYVDLGRQFAVWNVYATPALSLQLQEWCYPIAGCAVYRGYFNESAARHYAARLAAEGVDVYVGGVVAFSTLGWFDGPVLNTFVGYSDYDLPGLIFHELAHSRVYAANDSRFNESFATFVEEEGLARWFAARNDPARFAAYQRERQLRDAFLEFMTLWRERFAALYRSDLPDTEKRAAKDALIIALRAAYQNPATSFHGRYDAFFGAGLNNARMATLTTYYDLVPAFRALRMRAPDWSAFYQAVEKLAQLPAEERERQLAALAEKNPGARSQQM